MLLVFGWVIVRTSRESYGEGVSLESMDDLDDQVDAEDRKLWQSLQQWLQSVDDPWLKWQFFEEMNNARGVLQFFTSKNHRASSIWQLMEWIAKNGAGSYGIVYVHDDEDEVGNTIYGRGEADFSNAFRVWRILNGKIEEFDDPFLSPIVPRINPSEYV